MGPLVSSLRVSASRWLQAVVPAQTSSPSPSGTPALGRSTGELTRPSFLPDVVPTGIYQLAMAVVLVLAAYYVSKLVRRMLGRRIARRFKRPSVTRTILRSIQLAIVLLAALAGLNFMGFGFGNLALSVGVFSAVLGIVLAPIIGNVLSGVFVLNEQPYEIGDMIELRDIETKAFVEDITLLYTKVFTIDNTFLVLPNGQIRDRDVFNYSAEDTRIRMTVSVGVTYESDVASAREAMESAARRVDSVIKGGPAIRIGSARYPASPTCFIEEFGDSEVLLTLRYWVREPYRQRSVRSKVLTNVWEEFEERGIEIPYPHSHVVFDDTSGELPVAMRETGQGVEPQESGATRRSNDAVRDPETNDSNRNGGTNETKDDDGRDGDATDSR